MLYIILYLFLFIGLISFFIHGLYSYNKSCKEEQKDWEEFLKSLIPGSTWVLQKESSANPFDDPDSDIIVTIVETRKSCYGETWVQYRFKNTGDLYEKQASDFKNIYHKLN